MKNRFDVLNDIRSLIDTPEVRQLITGGIWPSERPDNSTKSDIVIGCINITNTEQQIGEGNVNIYLLAITVLDDNGNQRPAPDYAKLDAACKVIEPLIDEQYRATFRTYVTDSGKVFRDTDGSWFCNIGYKYYSIQDN